MAKDCEILQIENTSNVLEDVGKKYIGLLQDSLSQDPTYWFLKCKSRCI